MRIPTFSVQNQRAIRLAAWEALPRVMIVTGPNGSGKSTLLNALRQQGGDGKILYLGPHRTSRRQQVQMRHLGQNRLEMSTLLSSNSLPGFEGINLPSRERDAWNFDEAQSYLKYSFCQIELERQAAIAERFDKDGVVSRADMPDVWEPLRRMASNLLPHLTFRGIDISNRDQIRCQWEVHQKNVNVDIDDLSSGEKAVIQLFFPLVEHHVSSHLAAIRKTSTPTASGSLAVLMDEPELHLHPNLQGKVLDYIRRLSLAEDVQFIIATHSPSIVEQATSDELFLLRPMELTPGSDNQLIRVSSDDEKLALLRQLFGTTSNVTAMRRILVVEGAAAHNASRRPSDAKIYGFLSDRFGQLSIVSGGGRSQCEALVEGLNVALNALSPSLKAVALVDRDVDITVDETDAVHYLPVSMIENLLVDPEVIWSALTVVHHKLSLASSTQVAAALDKLCDELTENEVSRRMKASFAPEMFRLQDPIANARSQVEEFANSLLARFSTEHLAEAQSVASAAVQRATTETRRREFFAGKEILDRFFKCHVAHTGMSKEIFVYGCAREASQRTSVKAFVEALFSTIGVAAPSAETAS